MNGNFSNSNKELEPLSFTYKVILLILFFIFSLILLYISFSEMINLVLQLTNEESVLVYSRGSILGLGAGVGLLSFTLLAFVNVFWGDSLARKFLSVLKYAFIFAFILILVVPFLVDSKMRHYAMENDYISCESAKASGSWPMFETTYFTASAVRCESFTTEIKNERDAALRNLFH